MENPVNLFEKCERMKQKFSWELEITGMHVIGTFTGHHFPYFFLSAVYKLNFGKLYGEVDHLFSCVSCHK